MRVEPIRNKDDIRNISKFLKSRCLRDYCIFMIGINTALRMGDILNLKYNAVRLAVFQNQDLVITESKTKKQRSVYFNDACRVALMQYLESGECGHAHDFLFTAKRSGKKLETIYLRAAIKRWCRRIHGNFGAHTLRKTFAYHAYQSGVSIEHLQRILNHTSSSTTYLYIGVTPKDITDIYDSINLG